VSAFFTLNISGTISNTDDLPASAQTCAVFLFFRFYHRGLLIPHEAIRRQMTMMLQSVSAMPDSPSDNELWKVTLFAVWFCDYFFVIIEEHHNAEEKVYFPWIKTKAEYPEKEFNKDHEELETDMTAIKAVCKKILRKKGKNCNEEIAILKNKTPAFETDMRAHLKEEEGSLPALLRDNFTQEEEGVAVEKIIKAGGLVMAKKFLPAIMLAMQEWAKPGLYEEFCGSMPPCELCQISDAMPPKQTHSLLSLFLYIVTQPLSIWH